MKKRVYKLSELAEVVGGAVEGDGATLISGVAGIKDAKRGEITFISDPRYEEFVRKTRASAIIAREGVQADLAALRVDDPYLAFLRVLTVFAKQQELVYPRGIHATAVVAPDAVVDEDVSIGPYCQVNSGARIGRNTTILLGGYVGADVVIGEDCLFYPNVTIREGCEIGHRVIIHPGAVIGSDGFGYVRDGEVYQKVPHIGRVIIEDDVEIGSNAAVDRATTGITRVGRGTKLDNLVQIGHNVVIGKNSALAGQVGIGGSTELGDSVILGGQAGCIDHLTIGNRVVVAAQTGVLKSFPDDTTLIGYPAREHRQQKKLYAHTARLPELYKRVRELEEKIEELEKRAGSDKAAEDDK